LCKVDASVLHFASPVFIGLCNKCNLCNTVLKVKDNNMNTDQKKQFIDLVTSLANNTELTKVESILTMVFTLEVEGRTNELYKLIELNFPEYFRFSFPEHLKN
jgi:hypothetical protein